MSCEVLLDWQGPLIIGESDFASVPDAIGVYLWTVEIEGRYRVFYVGESAYLRSRWSDQLWWQLGGRFHVYDPEKLRQGQLSSIYSYVSADQHLREFTAEVAEAANQMTRMSRLWYARLPPEFSSRGERLRVESALHTQLMQSPDTRDFISNGQLSLANANCRRIRITNRVPGNVEIVGLSSLDGIIYGALP